MCSVADHLLNSFCPSYRMCFCIATGSGLILVILVFCKYVIGIFWKFYYSGMVGVPECGGGGMEHWHFQVKSLRHAKMVVQEFFTSSHMLPRLSAFLNNCFPQIPHPIPAKIGGPWLHQCSIRNFYSAQGHFDQWFKFCCSSLIGYKFVRQSPL